ncbi:MAG TPA: tRNA (adenosine(37)-N6)-threonylcarbamoyltransferase complex dimerization subunit type 1 TsaB [Candidatus Eremiobacteraceae bacterium]|nr:tRNA (adenosine(37)-N6)-threonylcarbamoyltransferase complex dimerization subunit type 1 TsaB [Candidatus Eremiobacteraceae bacterium]
MNSEGLVVGISTAAAVEVALLAADIDVAAASDQGALESLAALLKSALHERNRAIDDITLIGVCTGPGSFTGLRIGVAFAKSLAQTKNIPIVGVSAYDVAAFHVTSLPVVSVARGKRDYYYARLTADRDRAPQFIAGSKSVIERAAADLGRPGEPATIAGPDFSTAQPGDAARAVAQLACQAQQSGLDLHWTNIAIDYGQRPNAVLNWEQRRRSG